jgi:hypothetical protein
MDRRNILLSVLVLVQAGLAAFLLWPSAGSNAAAGALITGVTADAVTAVTIQGDDNTINLAKTGDSWVLSDNGDFPVDAVKVTELISNVLTVDTSRLVARTASSHNRLQVAADEYVRQVDLTTNDGATQTIFIGSSPSLRATNVRLADDDLVYLTSNVNGTDIRTDIAGWINTSYLQAPTDQVQAVTIENANGVLEFTRVNTDTWTLNGLAANEVFNSNNFTTILTRLSDLNMVEPVGKEARPEFSMDAPSATVTIVLTQGDETEKTLTLTIGAKDEGGSNYYAKSSDSEYYVKIASFTGDQFVNDTRDRYLQPPPTPEAGSGAITTTAGVTTATPITSIAPLTAMETLTSSNSVTETTDLSGTRDITATETVTETAP